MMQRSSKQSLMPVAFALIFLLGLIVGYTLNGRIAGGSFFGKIKGSSLQEISNLIKAKYVDEVDVDSINAYAADEMLSHLDPHSIYIPSTELERVNDQMEGQFVGIGIMYNNIDDTLNIIQLINESPAQKAGLLIGDKLLKANDSISLIGKNVTDAFVKKNMRGAEGSILKLTLLRNGIEKKIGITRAAIPIPSIDASYLIEPKIGYIKINKFAERTYEEFMQSLEGLQKQGIENLIVDLRGNGGGYMHAATAIADEFLNGDKLIVYTQGDKSEKNEFRCKKEGIFEKGKLIVLIDETAASASEVLAGALQDWDRATIIGRRSFGKGLVQQQFNLSDGGALRLTVARYYTPLGRNIQKPYNRGKSKYMHELEDRYIDGEMTNIDSTSPKGKPYKTPQGHTVYGGGGITPDYFVAYDTSNISSTMSKVYFNDIIEKFVYKYYTQNKSANTLFKTATDVNNKLILTTTDWNMFNTIALSDSVDISGIAVSTKEFIIQRIKATAAKVYLNDMAYFQIINANDNIVKKALEVIK